jgi:hypothetical protein
MRAEIEIQGEISTRGRTRTDSNETEVGLANGREAEATVCQPRSGDGNRYKDDRGAEWEGRLKKLANIQNNEKNCLRLLCVDADEEDDGYSPLGEDKLMLGGSDDDHLGVKFQLAWR